MSVGTGGGGGGGGGAGDGVGITSINIPQVVTFDASADYQFGSIDANQATGTLTDTINGLHNVRVKFPSAWNGGPVVHHAPGRDGATVAETFTYVGPTGAETYEGSVVVTGTSSITCTGSGSGAKTATIHIGKKLCLANAPITALIGCYIEGGSLTANITSVSLSAGTFELGFDPTAGLYHVLYTIEAP